MKGLEGFTASCVSSSWKKNDGTMDFDEILVEGDIREEENAIRDILYAQTRVGRNTDNCDPICIQTLA